MALSDADKSWRLPEDQYFNVGSPKTGIALHHTVGGTARSTFEWWLNDGRLVGTAYIIARNGTIHEIFHPAALGLAVWPAMAEREKTWPSKNGLSGSKSQARAV